MAKKSTSKKKSSPKKKATSKKKSGGNKGAVIVGLLGAILILFLVVSHYYKRSPESNAVSESYDISETLENSESRDSNAKIEESKQTERVEERARVETKETNPNLPDVDGVDEYYFTNSFDFAWPAYTVDDLVVEHNGYALSYDEENEQPFWVAYKLEKKNLDNARFKRKDNFREDPLVRTGSADLADYKGSGYDRGHLAPAADFTWDKNALDETFFMSNMSPQEPSFNRGIWKALEEQVRDWARANNAVYVVTGPLIEKRKGRIGKNKVAVPDFYYKVILDIQEPELKGIAFVLKNEKSSRDIYHFAISIDELEKQTGLDFFPSLPDDLENDIEGTLEINKWK
ncbi:MAG: DNA/RNA non-specific endonuclease [Cyclobacteriaceae bacterium]